MDEAILKSDCKKLHRMKDCRNKPEADKTDLYKTFYDEKKNSAKAVKSLEKIESIPDLGEGRCSILLVEEVEGVVLGDYGSYFDAISNSILKRVAAAEVSLVLTELEIRWC